ncbi:cytochrome P450 [Marasmius fiardii PR-910]|nr:cytochrome P450 [Marasmius fiardii PR-910]
MVDFFKSLSVIAISLIVLRLIAKRYRRWSSLPPGPKGLPILGNVLEFRAKKRDEPLHLSYFKMSQVYGDVFTFDVFGTRTVVLNSHKAIIELLEQRSRNYSGRPDLWMARDLMRWDWMFGFMQYSDSWRLHRRTFHQFFRPQALSNYYDIQRKRTGLLIQKLLKSPENFFQHIRAHAGGITLEVVYGYQIQDNDDPHVKLAEDAMEGFSATYAGSFLVDYFPILRYVPAWFPGAGFKTKAKSWAQASERMVELPWTHLKRSMAEGSAVPCYCTRNLEKFGISPTSSNLSGMETVIKNSAAIAYGGGADTVVSVVLSFILAMVLNPEIQVRAQKELGKVIESSGLPDFTVREELPYINAILAETLRWKPVTPLANAHRAMNDDTYEGHFIPGGSIIVPNAWAILHDESLYGPDTASFNPDRFMKKNGRDLPPSPELFAFGFGRRICPGRHFALNSIWFTMIHLLTSFTMAKEVNDQGKEIDLVVEYQDGTIMQPLPFNCRFIPRPEASML